MESYQKYLKEREEIDNINELYVKFRNLKLYESEYDINQELKKELTFWNKQKTPKEIELESQLNLMIDQAYQAKTIRQPNNENRFHHTGFG